MILVRSVATIVSARPVATMTLFNVRFLDDSCDDDFGMRGCDDFGMINCNNVSARPVATMTLMTLKRATATMILVQVADCPSTGCSEGQFCIT